MIQHLLHQHIVAAADHKPPAFASATYVYCEELTGSIGRVSEALCCTKKQLRKNCFLNLIILELKQKFHS